METIILIICGAMGAIIYYLLEEIRRVNEESQYQYVQAKLSNVETNLCLVKYLLKGIGK